jgi:hypothetical protein
MVDGISGPSAAAVPNPSSIRTRLQDVDAAVAKELGMSTDDLDQALRSGQSLDEVAQSKGVSHDDLVSTITQALQGSAGTGQTSDPSQLQQLAERIAGAKGHHHHHHRAAGVDGTGDGAGGAQAGPGATPDVAPPAGGPSDPTAVGFRIDTRA